MPITLGRFGRPKSTLVYSESEKNSQEKMLSLNQQEGSIYPSETSVDSDQITLVLDWLLVCLMEGHIEPSQPRVGRLCGWPLRSFACESLYVDFECWCIKRGLLPYEQASGKIFYSMVDRIFMRHEERYDFPALDECRLKFKALVANFKNKER